MNNRAMIFLTGLLVLCLLPELAQALSSFDLNASADGNHIANAVEKILEILTGKLARVVAVIAVTTCGYLAFLGHLGWKVVINVAIGIAIIFGASSLTNLLIGA